MKTKEFIELSREMLERNQSEYSFPNGGPESIYLREFRGRNLGEFYDEGSQWKMIRAGDKIPVKIIINRDYTIVDHDSLKEIISIITAEVNDVLIARFGDDAELHEYIT